MTGGRPGQVTLRQVTHLDREELRWLLEISLSEGFRIVERLIREYDSGQNRFDKTGEVLYAVRDEATVGVGGINQEPDPLKPRAGRIRRVYVAPSVRGRGQGRLLVSRLVAEWLQHFSGITCNVGILPSRPFYERLGFVPVAGYSFTHVWQGAQGDHQSQWACRSPHDRPLLTSRPAGATPRW